MRPLNELHIPSANNYALPELSIPRVEFPSEYRRASLLLPEIGRRALEEEFADRAAANISVDSTVKGGKLYPLGSCTMIETPQLVRRSYRAFKYLHPYQPLPTVEGALSLMYDLERILSEMGGAHAGTLQPAAGAHSELTALLMIAKYFESNGQREQRRIVLIPDSAHGTNPATAMMAGYNVVPLPSDDKRRLDYEKLSAVMRERGSEVAALMITHPSTYGVYDEKITDITSLLHEHGALVYGDGANFVALSNRVTFGDLGIDVFHFNLHKTFGVPHGGGGPGAGYVGANEQLTPFLPVPWVVQTETGYALSFDHPDSIGTLSSAYGNFLADVMAYTYTLLLGADGFRETSAAAVLTGNYMQSRLREHFPPHSEGLVMHEGIVLDTPLSTLSMVGADGRSRPIGWADFVKALLERGHYAPTVAFPVHKGILSEPTYSATKPAIDRFVDDCAVILGQIQADPNGLAQAPRYLPVGRLQEAASDRNPVPIWRLDGSL
ncbi:aminotransferase class V-fold PLP-dependent enzyme [Candidatus Woesearchaeota archaeon]|nr:aminotransferase class V-fold PLP-dependent enzyme [Candidatus Woesearchaeota archaeon]